MNVEEQRRSSAESVCAAIELLNDLQGKIADYQCDDLPTIAERLILLQGEFMVENAAEVCLSDDKVFFLAVDIEANLYEHLGLLDESRHTLSAMIEELHTLSSTLHANMTAMNDKC